MDPEEVPVLPQRIEGIINRPLETIDIEIIFRDAGPWWLFYALLLSTGLRCVDVALLTLWNFDHERGVLRRPEGRTGRFSEIPLAPKVLEQIPSGGPPDEPLFHTLYTDIEDQSLFEEEMNSKLGEPLRYLQALLAVADRPVASLFSFTLTHRNLSQSQDQLDPERLDFIIRIVEVLQTTGGPTVLN